MTEGLHDSAGSAMRALLHSLDELAAAWRRESSMSANEEIVLRSLARGVTSPTELSHTLGMTTAGMTNLLDRLEREGLVRRERHAHDGRRVLVTPTKRGFQLWRSLDEVVDRIAGLLGGHSPNERELVLRFVTDAAGVVGREARSRDDA